MSAITNSDWLDIIDDISDQKAVLLIGPEILNIDGIPLHQRLRDALYQRNEEDIAYYYERDGLYLFKSPEGKVRVARQVKRFYRDITPNDAVLLRLAQIPFHLIISLNPDTFVSEAFYKYGIKHRFHYFQHRQLDNENDEIEKPTKALPLIYNMFGSKDQDDSLVLDYDDVYKLLLKFLSDTGRREKLISINNPMEDTDTHQFIIRQFQIQFMGDQFDFFGELHRRCAEAKILRPVAEQDACPVAVDIRKRVAMGEIDNALELLQRAAAGENWENDVVLLQGRYSKLEDDKDRTDSRDYRTNLAQILDTLLEYTKLICP